MGDKYLIVLLDSKITVSTCENGELSPLKREGEEEQKYEKNDFWNWFKEKIEYNNEELSFIVITNQKDFFIDKEITLSQINNFEKDLLCKKRIEKLNNKYPLLSFPSMKIVNLTKNKKNIKTPKKIISPKKVKNITKKTVADIFNQQTQEYENEKI